MPLWLLWVVPSKTCDFKLLMSLDQGGKITQEYSLIKGFAATVSNEIVDTITTLSKSHQPLVEDDSPVKTQQQEPLEH